MLAILLCIDSPKPQSATRAIASQSERFHERRTPALRITHASDCLERLLFVINTVERDPHQARVQSLLGHPLGRLAAVWWKAGNRRYGNLPVIPSHAGAVDHFIEEGVNLLHVQWTVLHLQPDEIEIGTGYGMRVVEREVAGSNAGHHLAFRKLCDKRVQMPGNRLGTQAAG